MVKLDIKKLKQAAKGDPYALNETKPRSVDEYLAGVNAEQRVSTNSARPSAVAPRRRSASATDRGVSAECVLVAAWANHCAFYPIFRHCESGQALKTSRPARARFVSPRQTVADGAREKLVSAMAENGA
jgi:hypothetical protein